MISKQVLFYSVTYDDLVQITVKLCEKLYESMERVLLLCEDPDEQQIKVLNSKMWTFSKLSYIPHGSRFSMPITDAMYARIWISAEIEFINKPTCLLVYNGKASLPNSIQSFDKIIDIFDKNQIGLARNRAICYKTLEFDNQVVWFHNKTNNGWSKENELM